MDERLYIGALNPLPLFLKKKVTHGPDHNTNAFPQLTGLILHYGDMTDSSCLAGIIAKVRPTEIYNLAAQSHVKVSFEVAEYTADVDGVGTLRLLDAIRSTGLNKTRFYQVYKCLLIVSTLFLL